MAGIGGPSDWVGGGGMVCLCSAVPGVSPVHAWCYMDLSVRSLLRPVSLRRHSRHFLCQWREAAPPLVMGIENKNMEIPLASIGSQSNFIEKPPPRVLFADSRLPVVQQNVRNGNLGEVLRKREGRTREDAYPGDDASLFGGPGSQMRGVTGAEAPSPGRQGKLVGGWGGACCKTLFVPIQESSAHP